MNQDEGVYWYNYLFAFDDGRNVGFRVSLDCKTLRLISPERSSYPEWTALDYFKCPICPLESSDADQCPAAVSLIEPVQIFGRSISHEEVQVTVETGNRRYAGRTRLQNGLSSMLGICMAASGCPVLEKLKPMARHHLPFATDGETTYRAISMYLLAQFFLARRGKTPDWELRDLVRIYEDVRTVNRAFSRRLAGMNIQDASMNALVILDCFADAVRFSADKGALDDMEPLFSAYFR